VTVENYGVDGAISYSFTSSGTHRSWTTSNARWFLINFGWNDQKPDAWLTQAGATYSTNAQMAAAMTTAVHNLVTEIRALGGGAEPVLWTDPRVDYPRHHYWDRNPTIDYFNGVLTGEASNFSVPIVDLDLRFRREIARGNWDLRIRQDGTLDDSLDYLHAGDADATWWTDIHPNPRGSAVIADELADGFERTFKRSVTGTAQQVGAIRTLIDGLRGYTICDCPMHGTNTEGVMTVACPCSSRTSTNASCPYITAHDSWIEGNVYRLSLRAEQDYLDAREAAIAAGGSGTALQQILAACPDPA
jgi:lysophospholipase L1-like esterase